MTNPHLTVAQRARALVDLARRASTADSLSRSRPVATAFQLLPNTEWDDLDELLTQLRGMIQLADAESAGGLDVAGEWVNEALQVATRAVKADNLASKGSR
jgi:hypothetical protein